VQLDQQLMSYVVLFRGKLDDVERTVLATKASRHHVMLFNEPVK
jgi:hypothetical protein